MHSALSRVDAYLRPRPQRVKMDVVDIMLLQWAAMDSPVPQFNRGRAQSFLHFRSSLLKVHLLLSLASGGESTYSLQESIFHILK